MTKPFDLDKLSPGVALTIRQIENETAKGDLNAILVRIAAQESLLADCMAVLNAARVAALLIMHDRECVEALEANAKASIDYGAKVITWDEDMVMAAVRPLLDDDEARSLIERWDEEKIEHHFKVKTASLKALAKRRGGRLAEAVAAAHTESFNSPPRVKVELRIKGDDD